MKIIFMGTPEFAIPSLNATAKSGHEIVSVVTNVDEPQGRGLKVVAPPVKVAALSLGLSIIQVSSLRDPEFHDRLKSLTPDIMVVVAFRILPKEVFTIPKLGTFNLHASLLPRYRGAAPINWAIINGERETGVTTFFLDEKMDTGRIILQKRTPIGEDETAGELSVRLSQLGSDAVVETLHLVGSNRVQLLEQDSSQATKAPKISREDCLIDWTARVSDLHNRIRGFSPEPAAFTYLNGKLLKIFRSRPAPGEESGQLAGEITVDSGRLYVSCSDGLLEILELQLEGKKKLGAGEFIRGARLAPGTRLGRPGS